MNANDSLENKVALVTSSRPGTCAEMAKQLASAGAKVVVCGRNANQGLATVRQIRQSGGRATFVLADIAVIADVRATIDETIATYGRLDILLNDVSNSYAQDAPMPDVSESVWDRIIEPLLKGTFFCCQLSLPFLQQCDGGTIINLIEKTPGLQGRSVSKICQGGAVAMTGAIAQQFAASNVTANLIWATPLATQTPEVTANADATPARDASSGDRLSKDIPSGETSAGETSAGETSAGETSLDEAQLSLLLGKIITRPTDAARPFTNIAEAVMYLAHHGHSLHGAALWVHASEPASNSGSDSSTKS